MYESARPGQIRAAMGGWFARFPVEVESPEDLYLLYPRLRTFSVKVRGEVVMPDHVLAGPRPPAW